MAWMDDPLEHGPPGENAPQPRPRPAVRDLVLGTIVAVLFATSVVVAAIIAFDVNPVGPVIVVVAAIAAGSFSVRRLADVALKAAAIGLIVGGIAAILLWPFFDV